MRAPGSDSRRVAVDALEGVLVRGATLDDALRLDGLNDARDRGLAVAIAREALRRRGEIDNVLAHFLERPLPAKAARVYAILIAAAAEILILDIPPHAAVDSAVGLARMKAPTRPFAGLINAVLRRLAREGARLREAIDAPRANTPDAYWQRWVAAYGEETVRAIAAQHLGEPPLDLTVKSDAAGWADRLGGKLMPNGSVRLRAPGAIEKLPGFADGAWWVQDAAATAPALVLAARPGERVLDLCAAPGGKTAQIANTGAVVTAVEIDPKRATTLKSNLARLGLEANVQVADALTFAPSEPFDAVLLDAPCSATGTIRRHPDLPHRKSPDALGETTALQSRLLDAAANHVRSGGRLVYAVCSLEREEGEAQIEAFLARRPGFARLPIAAGGAPGFASALTTSGDLRTLPCHWPHEGGMDGFFVARMARQA